MIEFTVQVVSRTKGPRGGRDRLFIRAKQNGKYVGQITTSDPLKNADKINAFFRRVAEVPSIVDKCDDILL